MSSSSSAETTPTPISNSTITTSIENSPPLLPLVPPPSAIELIHRVNPYPVTVVGALLNGVLLFLIICRTPKEMSAYSKILLQTSIGDCAMIALNSFLRIIFFVDDGMGQLLSLSFRQWPSPWNHLQFYAFIFFVFFAIFGCAAQFINRYLILNKSQSGHYWRLLSIAICVTFIFIIFASFLGYPGWNCPPGLLRSEAVAQLFGINLNTTQVTLAFCSSNTNPLFVVLLLTLLSAIIGAYAIITFCGWQMLKFVRANLITTGTHAQRSNELNQQLTRTLIIQALLPVFTFAPLMFAIVMCLVNKKGEQVTPGGVLMAELFAPVVVSWFPALNPLVAILNIRPYRDAFLSGLLRCRWRGEASVSPSGVGGGSTQPGLPKAQRGLTAGIAAVGVPRGKPILDS